MNCIRLTSLACALTAALALSACNKAGETTTPSGSTGSTTTSPPASAASR